MAPKLSRRHLSAALSGGTLLPGCSATNLFLPREGCFVEPSSPPNVLTHTKGQDFCEAHREETLCRRRNPPRKRRAKPSGISARILAQLPAVLRRVPLEQRKGSENTSSSSFRLPKTTRMPSSSTPRSS